MDRPDNARSASKPRASGAPSTAAGSRRAERASRSRCDATEAFPGSVCELAALAHALGHPARVAIIRQLSRKGTCCCGVLVDALPLAQATVSQHLRMLKDAGLIEGEIDGPRVCYCVNPGAVRRLQELIQEL